MYDIFHFHVIPKYYRFAFPFLRLLIITTTANYNDYWFQFGKKWFKPHEASNLRQKLKSILAKEFKRASKALKNGTDDLT